MKGCTNSFVAKEEEKETVPSHSDEKHPGAAQQFDMERC